MNKGDTITQEQAEIQLRQNIDDRLVQIRKSIPNFDSLPLETRKHLLGSWYRGSLSGSPKTIGLINEGKYEQASNEFLNNNEYKTTPLRGVRDRMNDSANAFRLL